MTSNLVIVDSSPLDNSFVPDTLRARDTHITEVMNSLNPFLAGGSPLHVLLFGRPGTGKTAITKNVLKRVQEETQVKTEYVNCWEFPTLYGVADSLVKQLRVMFAERSETIHKLEGIKKVLGRSRSRGPLGARDLKGGVYVTLPQVRRLHTVHITVQHL